MRPAAIALCLALVAAGAEAQVIGYGVAGVGRVSPWSTEPSVSATAGAELFAGDRASLGGEVGQFDSLIVGSANATLHLGALRKAIVLPYITAGYSMMRDLYGAGAFSAVNAGAGLHYWATDRVGLRVELRDYFRPEPQGTTRYWSIRAGIAIR